MLLLVSLALAEDPPLAVPVTSEGSADPAPAPGAPADGAPPSPALPPDEAPAPAQDPEADPGPAGAKPEPPAVRPTKVSFGGELRLLGSLPPDPVVDSYGTTLGQSGVLDSRLRAALGATWDKYTLRTEIDLFSGQLAGDAWDISGETDARHREDVGFAEALALKGRRLSVEGPVGPVMLEAGLMTSHWGLGMLANDGAHDPWFGRSDFGDRVIRLRVATRPIKDKPLTLVLAGDRVIEDETAEWSPFVGEGQAAWQGIGSVIWGKPETGRVGLYGVYRHQTEADFLRVTSVGVLDLYADAPVTVPGWKFRFAGEAAGITGTTSRAQSYNSRDGLDVRSAGATVLVEARPDALPIHGAVRAGWASGDGDPDDGKSQDFTFDRDFDVGMVLFDELQGAIDAATYAELTDPEHSGGAPDGAETLVAEGAVRHAAFVQKVLGVSPKKWLGLRAGVSFAWNTSPISQAFETYRNGGVPANHLGEATSGYALGTEVDWAVTVGDVESDLGGWKYRPAVLVQGGHLFASADMGGGTYTMVTATGRVRW